jgi:glycosyltransferase involved in cell wall biosynthesis
MSLRIAHVTATFPPYRGGTGNVCYHNARELARRGHEVHVFTAAMPGLAARSSSNGVHVHRLRPIVQVGNAPVLPGLMQALRGFDMLHLHYPFFGGEITALAAALNRIPLVITYHQDVFLDGVIGAVATTMRHTVGRLALRSATRLLFTSSDYGRASYVRPMLHGRTHLIDELPNGVDAARFQPSADDTGLRARHHLAQHDQVAMIVAGLDKAHYFKGVHVFLAALSQLPPQVKGLIVGDGDLRQSYERSAAALGLDGRVIFAGRVSEELLPRYYQMADVTVLPSVTMGEAFGLVLVESLACGTPVVASNIPGVRTVVDHGGDGLLAAPESVPDLAKQLSQLLALPAERRRAMGMAGRRKVEQRYSWSRIGQRLEQIYLDARGAAL